MRDRRYVLSNGGNVWHISAGKAGFRNFQYPVAEECETCGNLVFAPKLEDTRRPG